MPLSRDEILRCGFVWDPTGKYEGKSREASYDLQIGHVVIDGRAYDRDSQEGQAQTIAPQQTFSIVSRESVRVPKGVVVYAFLKTGFARRGLLALNTGIIDDGWDRPIATTVLNLAKDDLHLFANTSDLGFLRLVFHRIETVEGGALPMQATAVIDDSERKRLTGVATDYRISTVGALGIFPKSFMDIPDQRERLLKDSEDRMVEKSWSRVVRFATFFGILAVILSVILPPLVSWAANAWGPKPAAADLQQRAVAQEERIQRLETAIAALHSTAPSKDSKLKP